MRLRFIISEMWIGLRRNLTMTLGVLVTTAVALTLLGVGLFAWAQVGAMKDYWYGKVEVSVFLCGENTQSATCQSQGGAITDQQRQQLKTTLEDLPQVEEVYYEDEATAYKRFKKQFEDSPALAENVREGDLPASFRVKLNNPEKYEVVTSAAQGRPGVSAVYDFQSVLGRFFEILNMVRLMVRPAHENRQRLCRLLSFPYNVPSPRLLL